MCGFTLSKHSTGYWCLISCLQSPSNRQFCAVTADFRGTEEGEVRFVVGDAVEVLQLGHGGWWEVRKVETNEIGWIPASYLQEISSKSLLPVLETSI